MRKIITLGIMLLFLGMTISSSTGLYVEKQSTVATFDGNTLYVGGAGAGNYSSIQDAINDSSNGDTVYVYDDSSPYKESNITIQKSINLIGEDRDTTVIDGVNNSTIIIIHTTDWINISGFTIQNSSGCSIWMTFSDNNNISDNIFTGNGFLDMHIEACDYNYIVDNIFTNDKVDNLSTAGGIFLQHVSFTSIIGNIFTNCFTGITLGSQLVFPLTSDSNIISGNLFDNNNFAMEIRANNTLITRNTISNHTNPLNLIIPALILWGRNNNVSCNNFINNIRDAMDVLFIFSLKEIFTIRKNKNVWDGNFWGRPRLLPKIIFSYIRYERGFPDRSIFIPLPTAIDWHPASEPYDIEV